MDIRQDSGERAFILSGGDKLRNVEELSEKLLNMGELEYSAHVNSQKNDFSAWIRDVYGDRKLASDIEKAANAAKASEAIKKRLEETAPKIANEVVKAPKNSHTTVKKVDAPKVKEIKIARNIVLAASKKAKAVKLKPSEKKSLISRLFKKKAMPSASGVPDSHNFLTAYMAMQRPTVSHLYFSKGISDFLLGIVIGIVIGVILARIIM
jgi:hypothetical protein